MEYQFLGKSGLQVSRIGFGNMINFCPEDDELNTKIIKTLYDAGVNFFDTAENYAHGECEAQLGRAIKALKLPRERLVISTKIINCSQPGGNPINREKTLSRKHIIDGLNASLKRLQLDYVDIVFAHVYVNDTPIEEICVAFNQLIEDGKTFYWGTSNFNPQQIQQLHNYCDEHGLIKPVAEQCQYNMVKRDILESIFIPLLKNGLGTTIYSPLCGGLLTGKYNDGKYPLNSRATTDYGWITKERMSSIFFTPHLAQEALVKSLNELGKVAQELGYTQGQLSLAWVLRNKDVSTAIIGARNIEQAQEAIKAHELLKKWDNTLEKKIETILNNTPSTELDFRKFQPTPARRATQYL